MVPVPGNSTQSKPCPWQLKQNGCGVRTNGPQWTHCGATSVSRSGASQNGCVTSSANGSCIMAGSVPRLTSLIIVSISSQKGTAGGGSGRPPGPEGALGPVDLVDGG